MSNQTGQMKNNNFYMFFINVCALLGLMIFASCNNVGKMNIAKAQQDKDKETTTPVNPSNKLCEPIVYETISDNKECYFLQEKLINSAKSGNLNGIKEALENGASIEGTYFESYPALYTAAMFGQTEAVSLLIDNGANVNRILTFGKTPLKTAVFSNHLETVKVLIKRGADICNNTSDEGAALQIAQKKGYEEITQTLEDAGAAKCW